MTDPTAQAMSAAERYAIARLRDAARKVLAGVGYVGQDDFRRGFDAGVAASARYVDALAAQLERDARDTAADVQAERITEGAR